MSWFKEIKRKLSVHNAERLVKGLVSGLPELAEAELDRVLREAVVEKTGRIGELALGASVSEFELRSALRNLRRKLG